MTKYLTQTWADFYRPRIGNGYKQYCHQRYREFIDLLINFNPHTVCEEACGICSISSVLYDNRPVASYSAFDLCPDMLSLSRANIGNREIHLFQSDILNTQHKQTYDLIFSHGVLEHFSDGDIRKIILRQIASAQTAVAHYIPTSEWKRPSFGDERLLPLNYWISAFRPSNYITWNKGKDAVLIWYPE